MEVSPRMKDAESDFLKSKNYSVFVKKLSIAVMIASATTFAPVHAASQLTDAELDTKFLDVPIKSPYLTKKEADRQSAAAGNSDATSATAFENAQSVLVESPEGLNNPLLSGVEQRIRSLGVSDVAGVPNGVANSGIEIPFGAENYSFKWAGNVDQVYVAPPTNIDYLQSVYGADAEFYLTKPQVVRIEATSHRTN
ncbi:hypothetical protein [Aquirhabdus parva]|nr:hypothetical protein [Aquirhabdus parva]